MVEVFEVGDYNLNFSQILLFNELYKLGEIMVYGKGNLTKEAIDLTESICHRYPTVYYGDVEMGFVNNSKGVSPIDRSFIRILCERIVGKADNPSKYKKPGDILEKPWEDRDATVRVGGKDVMIYVNTILYRLEGYNRASVRGLGGAMPTVVAASNIVREEMPQTVVRDVEIVGKRETIEREGNHHDMRIVSGLKIELEI